MSVYGILYKRRRFYVTCFKHLEDVYGDKQNNVMALELYITRSIVIYKSNYW